MNKLISLLGKNSLLVNYSSFFALSLLLNVVSVYLPNEVNCFLGQLLKFLMLFSVAMYVTTHRKVIAIAFGVMLTICGANFVFGVAMPYSEMLQGDLINALFTSGISLLSLFILLLLWTYALPKMKGIVTVLFLLELYNSIGIAVLPQALTTLLGDVNLSHTIIFLLIPFVLLVLLFVFIVKNGRMRWAERELPKA